MTESDNLLVDAQGLTIDLMTGRRHSTPLVRGIDVKVGVNQVVGLLGETGAGKSLSGWSMGGLLRPPLRVRAERLSVVGRDIQGASAGELRSLRRHDLAYIVQNPRSALEPVRTCGRQLLDVVRRKAGTNAVDGVEKVRAMLSSVGIAQPDRVMAAYPHELSGGLAQRVVIAMALSGSPKLLIADEPTSSLDVTVQAQILALLRDIVERTELSILLITHDIGIAAHHCSYLYIMREGEVVEAGPTTTVLEAPQSAFGRRLIASAPRLDDSQERTTRGEP